MTEYDCTYDIDVLLLCHYLYIYDDTRIYMLKVRRCIQRILKKTPKKAKAVRIVLNRFLDITEPHRLKAGMIALHMEIDKSHEGRSDRQDQ